MKQFTATVYILQQDRALLIYHKKLQKWLPPGGHLEPDELPSEGAIREAKEETGLDVELISQENIWVKERWNAKSFERPYLCLLEEIPAHGNQPKHQHVDFVYIARPISTQLKENSSETNGIKWFTLDDLDLLERDVEIFDETYHVLQHLLMSYKELPSDPMYVSV